MSDDADRRVRLANLLAETALADKPDVVLHALEVGCGASALELTQAELDAAIERRRAARASTT